MIQVASKVFMIITIVGLFSSPAQACIWQSENISGISPYWPGASSAGTNIEVCFIAPARPNTSDTPNPLNPFDDEYRRMHQRNIDIIKRTVQNQLNAKTSFNLTGFNICPPNDTGAKIRIDLNSDQAPAANAQSIGPRSRNNSPNIDIGTHEYVWENGIKGGNRIRRFSSEQHISSIGLHEIMHLLGFHHSEDWDQSVTYADEDAKRVIQVGESTDPDSVMQRGTYEYETSRPNEAKLSDQDIACLNSVATRRMHRKPSRAASPQQPSLINITPASPTSGGIE